MTLLEALNSGKSFKRANHLSYFPSFLPYEMAMTISEDDYEATDWEVLEDVPPQALLHEGLELKISTECGELIEMFYEWEPETKPE